MIPGIPGIDHFDSGYFDSDSGIDSGYSSSNPELIPGIPGINYSDSGYFDSDSGIDSGYFDSGLILIPGSESILPESIILIPDILIPRNHYFRNQSF